MNTQDKIKMVVNWGIKKMDKRYGILVVSVTILVLCFVGTASATNWSVDGSGGADFIRIQDAINKASDGDTILVSSGVYYENVVVNKLVTLMGNGQPVIDAGGEGNAITLTEDGITLEGFTATNSGSLWNDAGIAVISNNNTITGSNATNNYGGIFLNHSSNNIITGNNASCNNADGIYLESSSNNNSIIGSNACSNYRGGIIFDSSSNNTLMGNNVSNNTVGIYLDSSSYNAITGNNATNNNDVGIYLDSSSNNNAITGNNASNNHRGIRLDSSSNNNAITGNNASNNNDVGIYLDSSSYNTITGGNACNNDIGIFFKDSSNNIINSNNACNNYDGISLYISNNNTINYKVEDAGQVILVNCNNITIENLDLSNTSGGIALWKTETSKISNNTVCNNSGDGIGLYYSRNNNIITGNNVSNNSYNGIGLYDNYRQQCQQQLGRHPPLGFQQQ
jgi:parallel beta-helix repeat protein